MTIISSLVYTRTESEKHHRHFKEKYFFFVTVINIRLESGMLYMTTEVNKKYV